LTETLVDSRPFYLPSGDEVDLFRTAFEQRIPVLLKGPTGCGKTRFVEYMAWCTRDLRSDPSSAELVGRHLLSPDGTSWLDGPLTRAVRNGNLCYLDEVVEARKDTTVVLHSLTDHRRMLPIERLGTTVPAHPDFLLVVSYNPGYQASAKDLKPSTRQRFLAIEFDYPAEDLEAEVIAHESGADGGTAAAFAHLGSRLRRLDEADVLDGPSTRLLVYAATLVTRGVAPLRACEVAVVLATSDDRDVQAAVRQVAEAVFAA
jgi:nitric oxide reductase NorQ protein